MLREEDIRGGSLGMKSGGNSKLPPGVFGAGVRGSGKTASSVSVGSGGKGMVASEEARASEALLAVKLQSDLFLRLRNRRPARGA